MRSHATGHWPPSHRRHPCEYPLLQASPCPATRTHVRHKWSLATSSTAATCRCQCIYLSALRQPCANHARANPPAPFLTLSLNEEKQAATLPSGLTHIFRGRGASSMCRAAVSFSLPCLPRACLASPRVHSAGATMPFCSSTLPPAHSIACTSTQPTTWAGAHGTPARLFHPPSPSQRPSGRLHARVASARDR